MAKKWLQKQHLCRKTLISFKMSIFALDKLLQVLVGVGKLPVPLYHPLYVKADVEVAHLVNSLLYFLTHEPNRGWMSS